MSPLTPTVVFDIRSAPELQFTQLTDSHDPNPQGDRFMSFHFHIQGIAQRSHPRDPSGQPTPSYPQVRSFSVYHGQMVFQNTRVGGGYGDPSLDQPRDPESETDPAAFPRNDDDWRVDFRDMDAGEPNDRTPVVNCALGTAGDYQREGVIYPGYPGNTASQNCNGRVRTFLLTLRNRGKPRSLLWP